MSPEYAMEGFFSFKSDVYSFGVMVLEIVSGKRNQGYFIHSEHEMNLLGHVSMGETTNFLKEKKLIDFCTHHISKLIFVISGMETLE